MWRIFGGGGQQRPAVDTVSPARGPVGGGIQARITGRNFNGASVVHFGRAEATFQLVSDAEIVVPSLPRSSITGRVDVAVTTAAGSTPPGNRRFEYLPEPVITSVVCTRNTREVRLTSRGLVDVQAVYFGTEPAECFEQADDGSILARRHRGKAGPTSVTVVTPGGRSPAAAMSFPADKVRALVVVISGIYMLLLIAGLLVYINWPTFPAHLPPMLGPLPLAVPWFGALGAVLLSISGLVDHFSDWDSSFAVWHLVRPLIGAVMGSVGTLIVISGVIASTGTPKTNPSLSRDIFYDVVAFLIGYREQTFRMLIKRLTDVIIGPGESKPADDDDAGSEAATEAPGILGASQHRESTQPWQ